MWAGLKFCKWLDLVHAAASFHQQVENMFQCSYLTCFLVLLDDLLELLYKVY